MGHYDECRDDYCGICGQTQGNCDHTKSSVQNKNRIVNFLKEGSNYCDKCEKNEVCKYKEIYYEKQAELVETINTSDKYSFMNIAITCKHFRVKITNSK
jgi:hypothetical protein